MPLMVTSPKGDPFDLLGAARQAAETLRFQLDLPPCTPRPPPVESTLARLDHAIALAGPLVKRVWTPSELAAQWHMSANTVRGLIDDREIAAFNVGRGTVPHWRITNEEALRFAEKKRRHRAGST